MSLKKLLSFSSLAIVLLALPTVSKGQHHHCGVGGFSHVGTIAGISHLGTIPGISHVGTLGGISGYSNYGGYGNFGYGGCYNRYSSCGNYGFGYPSYYGGFGYGPFVTSRFYSPAYIYPRGYGYGYGYGSNADTLAIQNELLRTQLEIQKLRNERGAGADNNPQPPVKVDVPLPKQEVKRDRQLGNKRERSRALALSGTKQFQRGAYSRAAELFRDAIKNDPKDASNHFFLAQALFASNRYDLAARAIEAGLKLNPEWLEIDFNMTDLYGDPQDLKDQINSLAQSLKQNPLERQGMFVLGHILFVTGEKDKARVVLAQSARLEADDRYLKPFFDYYAKVDNVDTEEVTAAKLPSANDSPSDKASAKKEPAARVVIPAHAVEQR